MWYICLRYAKQEAENDSHMAIASSRRTGSTNQATCGQRASLNHKTGARTFGVGPERKGEAMNKTKAKFAVNCYLCGGRIYVGDEIQTWNAAGNTVAAHKSCVEENMAGGQSALNGSKK